MRSRMRFGIFFTFLFLILAGSWADAWQTKAPATSSAPGISQGKTTPRTDNPATLAQLMQGIMFPNSNVIFASQSKKFTTIAPARDPSAATDPLQGTYGSWQAVENSSLAIVEAANLLNAPGRRCSNGRPVPTANPDWPKLIQGLRDAGMKSYEAARSKNQDKILDATDALTTACGNCHTRYRDKENLQDRCR